jgi:NADH-quinone oxidoreductase subunit K
VIQSVSPIHYLIVSALLFIIGTLGVLLRRNLVVILMSIELILNAVNINLVVFSHLHGDASGQVFALMVMAVAISEAAVGLGVLIALFRNRGTVLVDELDLLKW